LKNLKSTAKSSASGATTFDSGEIFRDIAVQFLTAFWTFEREFSFDCVYGLDTVSAHACQRHELKRIPFAFGACRL
jgi:hypothetical protein